MSMKSNTLCRIIISEYEMSCKIVPEVGTNFILEKFENFYRSVSMHCPVSSSYNHQSN